MKRITKQNLNDLAKVMPVLNEKQQFENVGGTYYVSNLSYEGLGFVGNSDVIYVISPSEFENAEATGDEYAGVALMGCDIFTQQMIFAAFAFQTIGYNGGTEVVSLDNDPRPIFYDTYSGRLKFNVATSSGVWGCKAALEAELHNVRASMSGNSSSSGAGSNTGGGFLTSGSESGNISGGVSGNVSGNVNVEIEAIKARVKELNEECTVDTPTGPKRDWNIYIYQIPEREGLASRLFICWQELGYDKDRGYTIEDAYKECGVDTTNAV
jgi:hypothetical protein